MFYGCCLETRPTFSISLWSEAKENQHFRQQVSYITPTSIPEYFIVHCAPETCHGDSSQSHYKNIQRLEVIYFAQSHWSHHLALIIMAASVI